MGRRALIGTVATLGTVAVVGLVAALSILLSSPAPAYAQGNNSAPTFSEGNSTSRSVAENTAASKNIGSPVSAIDPNGDTLTYSLDSAGARVFAINASTGQLKTKAALDYETAPTHSVTVKARDGQGLSDTISVVITVTDVNEPPEITVGSTVRYAENGTDPVAPYTATDPESGAMTWVLSGNDEDDFTINNGALAFRTPPNYEAPADADGNNVYLVTITVSDGTHTVTKNVAVTVFGVNEGPSFPTETASRSVDENTAAGQNLLGGAVVAVDPERHALVYKLVGTDAPSFDINASTGQLKTRSPLDYEARSQYSVTIQVRDSKDQDNRVNAVTDDTIDITINVNNVEEAGWILLSSRQPEIGTAFTAAIDDPDGSVTPTSWKWERSPQKGTWTTITNATAASYTPVSPADNGNYLRVTASYTDGQGSGKTSVGTSDNPVRDTPDSNVAPTFSSKTATRNVNEGSAAGVNIGTPVSATDADAGDANLLTYSLSGTDAGLFNINRATGQLMVKAPLDYEGKASHIVTVKAEDPSGESATITVTIGVNDVDEPPALSGPDVVDYPENGSSIVARYTANDQEGDTITWSLDGDDKNLFQISSTGELTFKSSPDHDIPGDKNADNIYLVTIKASDGTNSVTLPVSVTVSNVDEPPTLSGPGAVNYPENGSGSVAQYTASDPDGDTIAWSLDGDDKSHFQISSAGELTFRSSPDYDAPSDKDGNNIYLVTVTASGGTKKVTLSVTVTVSNVNEQADFPASENGRRAIAENTPAVQNIGSPVAATDPDNGDTLTYTLGGDDAASFAIDNSTGQLKTWDPLNYEAKSSYSATVSVTDGKDASGNNDASVDDTIDVTITVTDVAEAGTVKLSSLQPQVGAPLTATLEEPTIAAANVSWTWENSSSWSSGWTAISGATSDTYTPVTGDVSKYLRATASFTNSQNTQVSAYGVSAYPVRAAPANNAAPVFAASTVTRSIPENTPAGNAVGDPVTATDSDANDILTYSLSGTDAASFTIGMASGQLRTKAALDRETKSSYTVVVTATDPSGLSDTATVTITVTDRNEPPVISGKTSVSYAEDRTDTVATYTATDRENNPITWSLSGDDSGDFAISATGGLTFASQPDRENPADKDANNVYLVTVEASDETHTVSLDVAVTVTAAAEPPPAPGTPTVQAAATGGHTALSVRWQAPASDGGSPITGYGVQYRKQGADNWSSGNVTITGVTAAITNVLPDTAYEARVRAENADGWGAWSGPGTGRTDVTPLDQQIDLTVSYSTNGYTVNEGAAGNVTVTLSAATDRALQLPITVAPGTTDSGDYEVTGLTNQALAFVPGDSSKSFTFRALQDTDSSDETVTLGFGQLPNKVTAGDQSTTVVTIDDDDPVRRSKPTRGSGGGGGGGYRSGGGGGSGGNYDSTIVNMAPVFTDGTSLSRSVAENTAAGVNIGKPVSATDADNDKLTYTVGGDDGSAFAVDSATGQLKTKSALDFESKSSYKVTMGVFDSKGASDTIDVTITVTDVADAPLASGPTQMMGIVDSESETTIWTLDGSVEITFPSGSRSSDYQVRLDYGLTNCNPISSSEELWFCLTVDIFDNEGNLEQGVTLTQPATIKFTRSADERGGVDAVLALHQQGGVNVYGRGQTGGEWTELAFTLESNGAGGIVITITGVSSFGLYAGTTDSQTPTPTPTPTSTPQPTPVSQQTPTPTPTSTPQPTPAGQQSPTPTPPPTSTPQPTPVPEPTSGHPVSSSFGSQGVPWTTPAPAPTPSGIAKALGNLPLAPPPADNSVPTAKPEVKEASLDSENEGSGRFHPWYITIILVALAAMVASGGTYYMKRRRRLFGHIAVDRSREYTKWQ